VVGVPPPTHSFVPTVCRSGRQWQNQRMLREIMPPDTTLAFSAMRELRTGFANAGAFVKQVDEVQRPEGYRLVGVMPDEGVDADAVVGFRLSTSLSWGRHLYIDDLSTAPSARGQGFAGQLVEWVHNEANRLSCHEVHLDSGVGSNRYAAHRLYLNSGYVINAHHFIRREPSEDR
jgi:GNAT superfamily N-acetyltransferase